MSANWREYFRQLWPFDTGRAAVLREYAALGHMRHVLADIALRNSVFSAKPPAGDVYHAGIAEGRRQAALEIFQLANMPPEQLWAVVEKKPSGERTP